MAILCCSPPDRYTPSPSTTLSILLGNFSIISKHCAAYRAAPTSSRATFGSVIRTFSALDVLIKEAILKYKKLKLSMLELFIVLLYNKIGKNNLTKGRTIMMELHINQINALKEFCTLVLCGYDESVIQRCKAHLENIDNEYGGVPQALYVLSGQDVDDNDPFGNVADNDKQLVKPQYYFISSDAGAPNLEDFFWFVENLKEARGLDFTFDEEKFSDDNSIVEWLAELSTQLNGLYIVNFDGASEDYHFTILDQKECERARGLFKKMTNHIDSYTFDSFVITSDFQG